MAEFELKDIAAACSEFGTYYEGGGQMTFAPGGEGRRRCDFCINWQGGECDIYQRHKRGK